MATKAKPTLALVDSAKRKLDIGELVTIAAQYTKTKYPLAVVPYMLITEMQMENASHIQIGNTLFIMHKLPKPSQVFFRAINADTANRYTQNAIEFSKWAYEQGYDYAVTQFDDPKLLQLMRFVSKQPPNPQMGYKAERTQSGGYQVTIKLGPARDAGE